MRTNKKATSRSSERLAGGLGNRAAKSDAISQLRRIMMTYLLFEDAAYIDGQSIAAQIDALVAQIDDTTALFEIALEARSTQNLRHAPLYLAVQMARNKKHRYAIGHLLPRIIKRADELPEFLSLYWKDGRVPLANQVKKGLSSAFHNFDAYQFAKYDRDTEIKIRDVMFLTHPQPRNAAQARLFSQIANRTLPTPDTWEVELSQSTDKSASWTRLLSDGVIGDFALLKNLRNIDDAGVSPHLIRASILGVRSRRLLPLDFIKAARFAPKYENELEEAMINTLSSALNLHGETLLVVDVSGSMNATLSSYSDFKRLDAAVALSILTISASQHITFYATAGDDYKSKHSTKLYPARRGFGIGSVIEESYRELGGGGIFTRQCIDYIADREQRTFDRLIIISDSQDCDRDHTLPTPSKLARNSYIIDVSPHALGVNYTGVWTAEVSGWSQHFIHFINSLETNTQ